MSDKSKECKGVTPVSNATSGICSSEVLLVLDGSTGQNAFQQAKEFSRATDVNSLAVTKLDGTAKGGVVIGIVDQFQVPIRFLGIGEGIDDLKPFDKKEFVESLFTIDDLKK